MKKSFTLIEILVVATIIGLLSTLALVNYSYLSKQSRDGKRKVDLEQIRAALEMYRSNNDDYPDMTINCSSSGGLSDGLNTYLTSIPKDPKCNIYSYFYSKISSYDYILGAYLENGGQSCTAGCGNYCNYCLGPYGEK